MPEQRDRTERLSIAIRAVALLIVVAFVGFFPVYVGRVEPSAQAQSPAQSVQAKTPQTRRPTVIGRDCMRGCHDSIVESFALEIHGKSAKFLKDSRAAKCQICHDNSEKHSETSTQTRKGGDVVNPAKLPTAQANDSCLQCHSRDRYLDDWRGGKHDRSDMSCLSCHSVHHAKLSEKMLTSFSVEETCVGCHKDIRKALYQRSTHLFRTENWVPTDRRQVLRAQPTGMKVNCVSCHNPHGGEGRKMLAARSTNDVCYTCHAEKRGPLLWEHAPVQEDCLICHTPHGSNNASLLIRRSHQLCQQCHINMLPRHSTVAGFDVFTFNRGCVNCHTLIHGSNHPSGRTFTR